MIETTARLFALVLKIMHTVGTQAYQEVDVSRFQRV